jgi:hypothetical protein
MSSFGLWELMSSGSSANARKNALKTQPRYVSAEEFNAIPSPKEQWNNNSLYKSNVTPQISPTDMNGFQSTVTGSGNLNNGLWNNGVGVQNPLSVGHTPTQVDSVAKTVVGSGNATQSPSTPAPTLYASNQASNANGAPTATTATQEVVNPYELNSGMPDRLSPDGYDMKTNEANARAFMPEGTSGGLSGLWDSVSDFSSKDATKNSLGNISTGVNVGSNLFDAYTKYQTQKAQADYQNRIAGLYEKQYADTEARRANAQANYDASVPK